MSGNPFSRARRLDWCSLVHELYTVFTLLFFFVFLLFKFKLRGKYLPPFSNMKEILWTASMNSPINQNFLLSMTQNTLELQQILIFNKIQALSSVYLLVLLQWHHYKVQVLLIFSQNNHRKKKTSLCLGEVSCNSF